MRYNKEKGFTLIEFMVVIALIGIGLLFIVSQFKDAGDQNKSQTAIKNITQLASAVSGFKDTRNGFLGLTTPVLYKSSSAPSNMKIGGVLKNVFGGNATVSNGGGIWGNNYATIEYLLIPESACVDIASKVLGVFYSAPSVHGIKIQKNGAGAFLATTTLTQVATNCGAGNNTLRMRIN